jgi:hypothetical protein
LTIATASSEAVVSRQHAVRLAFSTAGPDSTVIVQSFAALAMPLNLVINPAQGPITDPDARASSGIIR